MTFVNILITSVTQLSKILSFLIISVTCNKCDIIFSYGHIYMVPSY